MFQQHFPNMLTFFNEISRVPHTRSIFSSIFYKLFLKGSRVLCVFVCVSVSRLHHIRTVTRYVLRATVTGRDTGALQYLDQAACIRLRHRATARPVLLLLEHLHLLLQLVDPRPVLLVLLLRQVELFPQIFGELFQLEQLAFEQLHHEIGGRRPAATFHRRREGGGGGGGGGSGGGGVCGRMVMVVAHRRHPVVHGADPGRRFDRHDRILGQLGGQGRDDLHTGGRPEPLHTVRRRDDVPVVPAGQSVRDAVLRLHQLADGFAGGRHHREPLAGFRHHDLADLLRAHGTTMMGRWYHVRATADGESTNEN